MRRQHSVPDLPSAHWGAQLSGSDAVKCFCWKSVCSTPYAEAEYMSTVLVMALHVTVFFSILNVTSQDK